MEKNIGIKRIGAELFVAVEKDWVQIDEETKKEIVRLSFPLLNYKEDHVFNIKFEFERMIVIRQYREVGVENSKTYEKWVAFKPGQRKPFYIKRRELAVFTLPQTENA